MPTVLIIDDAEDICTLLKHLLIQIGIDSECINTIGEATEILQINSYSLIILDNHLPDGFGVDFIDFIRRKHPASKIIMISAHDNHLDKELAFSKGAHLYIAKPFPRNVILEGVETLLNITKEEVESNAGEIGMKE